MPDINLISGFNAIKGGYVDYFRPYTYNQPVVLSIEKYEELKTLGQILYKAIRYMLENYPKYLWLMPREERDLEILSVCDRYPYQVGTFRTDFVVDQSNHVKIIEMTTRQPLNGYFTSGFFREIALQQVDGSGMDGILDIYPSLFAYLKQYIGDARHVCVIKGNEKLEEIKIYPDIFRNAGIECHVIPIEELPDKLHLLDGAWVIEELNFREIRSFPLEIIEALARCRLHNSIKTLLFTHDKRFFYVLNNPDFLKDALDPQEIEILKKYLVPTYVYGDTPEEWDKAHREKDGYIIKHQIKGKSVDVYAGCLTDATTWEALFGPENCSQVVLQPLIDQKRFEGWVGSEQRTDFVAGTLLYFNQEFFGPGLYRTSSLPVTNLKDNRKIAQLVGKVDETLPGFHYL